MTNREDRPGVAILSEIPVEDPHLDADELKARNERVRGEISDYVRSRYADGSSAVAVAMPDTDGEG